MIKTKKQMYLVIASFALVLLLGTTTYAFFNYTRTGASNIIKTGRIYFNSEQGTSINLTNLFPIDPTETGVMDDDTKVGTVTINVEGDTTYTDGIEYKVSAVNVQNTTGSKTLPISIQVSVENNSSNDPSTSLGTSDDDYFTNRGPSASTSIYKVLASDVIRNNQELVVGYIKSGQDGVDGNIVIKAYIDKNKIAISDTYPEEVDRTVNENFDGTACEAALTGNANASTICASSEALEGALGSLTNEQLTALVNAGVLREYTNGTPASFGEGRTVLTTEEWNGLQANGVSFQVKVEANEGVWVDEPGKIESCPGCVFTYKASAFFTPWNTVNQPSTVLTENDYSLNYEEIVAQNGKHNFYGVKLNSNNEIEKVYVCGIKRGNPNNGSFYCLESVLGDTKFNDHLNLLNGSDLWNGSCTTDRGTGVGTSVILCDSQVMAISDGHVFGRDENSYCHIMNNGVGYCQ